MRCRAGAAVEAEFAVRNDGDQRGQFHFEVEGLDRRWTPRVGTAYATAIDEGCQETLKLVISLPLDAAPGRRQVTVNIVSEGEIKYQKQISLEIEPPAEAEASLPIPPVTAADTAPPKASPRQVGDKAPVPPSRSDAPAASQTTDAARPPKEEPKPRAPETRTAVEPRLPDAPTTSEAPATHDRQETPAAKKSAEKIEEEFVINPEPGRVLPLRPGGKILLRFPCTNDTSESRGYELNIEDTRFRDVAQWVEPAKGITLKRASGELRVRMKAPLDAPPGKYPFTIRRGYNGGAVEYCPLTLEVLASPAVRMTAAETGRRAKAGPSGEAEFALLVKCTGNMDTAFRVGVTRPRPGTDAARQTMPVYESEDKNWRYLVDKEMGTVFVSKPGNESQDVPIRLRVARQKIGWFDFVKTDTLQITAIPVTDPENAHKPDNTVTLEATRWQVPRGITHLLLPLLLLVVLFGSVWPISDLTVENGLDNGQADSPQKFFVFGQDGKAATPALKWRPWLLPMTVSTPQANFPLRFGRFTDDKKAKDSKEALVYHVKGQPVSVQLVPVITVGHLHVVTGDLSGGKAGSEVTMTADDDETYTKKGSAVTKTFILSRQTHIVLNLENDLLRESNQNQAITYWAVQKPNAFKVEFLPDQQGIPPAEQISASTKVPGKSSPIKISLGTAQSGSSEDLVLATTDGSAQIIHIKLVAQ